MKTRWSERWSWQFILAVLSMLALMLLISVVGEALAWHAVASEAQIAWQARLERMEKAVSQNDLTEAVLLWREAYAAALRSRHWEGLIAVGDAYRRLGALGDFQKASEAKAREAYLAALFRARQDASVEGVLRVAEAFVELSDGDVVEECLRIALRLAGLSPDRRGAEDVRAFTERWNARKLEVETRHGALAGETIP
jgi:hypothetical protein